MKKIISTLLILAMVLTMALSVSAYDPGDTELVTGNMTIPVESYGTTFCYFIAPSAGTLTIDAAAGETNAGVMPGDVWNPVTLPWTGDLTAGQELSVLVVTLDYSADNIDLVISFEPSAGGGAAATTPADILKGNYDGMFFGTDKTHTFAFTPASEGATNGSVVVEGVNANYQGGTYSYTYEAATGTIATTTITAGSPDLTLAINGSSLSATVGIISLELVASTTQGGGGAAPADPILAMLDGAYYLGDAYTGDEYYNVVFTPAAAGADNGTVTIIDNMDSTNAAAGVSDINYSGTYTYTYNAATQAIIVDKTGVLIQVMQLGPSYTALLAAFDGETRGSMELVVDHTPPALGGGGNAGGGSANTGDSVALYVALGAVALASIFGCAIVSKKRIAE